MNWHMSQLGSAVLFLVAVFVFLFVLVGLLLVGVWFCLVVICDGLLDCTQVLYQFTLEVSQSADGLLNALINLAANLQHA